MTWLLHVDVAMQCLRREEVRLAWHWNVTDFRSAERERFEFTGDVARGFYSSQGHWVAVSESEEHAAKAPLNKRFLAQERRVRMVQSYLVISPIMLAVIIATGAILAYKSTLMFSFYMIFANDESELTADWVGVTVGSVGGGAMNGLFISLSNIVYARVAQWLNEWENHRTQTDFDDALIVKTMIFQFINSYVALYYIAFIKASGIDLLSWVTGVQEYCHDKRHYAFNETAIEVSHGGVNPFCMNELSVYMASVVLSGMFSGKVLEFLLPWTKANARAASEDFNLQMQLDEADEAEGWRREVRRYIFMANYLLQSACRCQSSLYAASVANEIKVIKSQQMRQRVGGDTSMIRKVSMRKSQQERSRAALPPMTFYEEQCKLEPFEGVFSEYSKLIIQLGYVVLFAPAFPLGSTIIWLSFFIELRTDAYKVVANTRRPRYDGAEDVGAWRKVLWTLAAIGVLTNLGLVGITETIVTRLLPFRFLWLVEINEGNRLLFLIVLEHCALFAQFLVVVLIPDTPEDVSVDRALQNWRALAPRQPPPPDSDEWNDRKDDELLEKGDEEGGIKLGDHFRLSFFDNYVNELKEQRKSEWRSV
mmetsp:Transcript_78992/g.157038  ORF Transcript_78992/g.157038 Transcript_78992/m.157038 type:complete len:593 (-) Transcript_78992:220-1998(-)